jgi:hypothetical protein
MLAFVANIAGESPEADPAQAPDEEASDADDQADENEKLAEVRHGQIPKGKIVWEAEGRGKPERRKREDRDARARSAHLIDNCQLGGGDRVGGAGFRKGNGQERGILVVDEGMG